MVTCSFCGASERSKTPPLNWSSATEHGELRWYCERCSRTYLRSMEGKLDSEWW